MTAQLLDLSHPVEVGMFTHPGLPGPTLGRVPIARGVPCGAEAYAERAPFLTGTAPPGTASTPRPVRACALVPDNTRRTDS
jgi:hypothetical protein